jgi:ubiquinone/menaquinone biosynthesis C-methylase UbiE
MGLYSRYIFPRLMDASLSSLQIQRLRQALLEDVRGSVFELGFGTGLNLPHYPSAIKRIVTADPNPGASALAARRIAQSGIEVDVRTLSGERVPWDDNTFDSIVCTFTLCSIPDPGRAVREMWRILRPSGRFHFLEHGLSDNPGVQWWQRKLTPLQRRIGDGCHLDRDAGALIRSGGFRIERMDNFYLEKVPRFGGYVYRGVAVKE